MKNENTEKVPLSAKISKSLQPNSPLFVIGVAILFMGGLYLSLCLFSQMAISLSTTTILILTCGISAFIAGSLTITKCTYSPLSRLLYRIVAYFWGFLVYYVIFELIFIVINPEDKTLGIWLVILPSFLVWIYGIINAAFLRVEHLDVRLRKVPHPIKLVHLSDIHLGPIYGRDYVSYLAEKVNKIEPDLVIITGDLFDGSTKISLEMIEPFNNIEAPIYMVLGNHDSLVSGEEYVSKLIEKTKIRLMRGEKQIIHDNALNLIGIGYSPDWSYLERKLLEEPRSIKLPNVLLYHVPAMKADKLEEFGIDLHLTGHTHGGQMFPFNVTSAILFSYVKGLHISKSGKTYVNVTEGAGTAGPPLRVMSNTTISVLEIHS